MLRARCLRESCLTALLVILTACAGPTAPPPSTTATPTASVTATPLPPTLTPSPTLPPPTATASATPTPVTPSATPTPTATDTPRPVILLLVNGGFETGDLRGWENNGGITISSAATNVGSFGAQMTSAGRIDQVFKTRPGQTYSVAARIRIDEEIVTPDWGGLQVAVYSSDWRSLAAGPFLSLANSPAGQWTSIAFTFVAATEQSRLVYQNFSGGGQFRASADAFVVSTK